jgi:RNA polymerase sigma-70 factor (ECF subfamily)
MEVERDTFWTLIDQEKDALWRLSRGLTGSYDEALDLMSETFLAAHKSFASLRDHGAFRQFLSTIAVRIYRRKRWRNRLFISLEDAGELAYEVMSESSHDLDLLLAALTKLPLRQREAIVLFEITGLSLREIQEVQGGTVQGVKSRLNRARHSLKRMLADERFILITAAPDFELDRLTVSLLQP